MHRSIRPLGPIALGATLAPLRTGLGDPTIRLARGEVWRATRNPDGPATLHLRTVHDRIEAQGWGPGAALALDRAADLVGCADDDHGFQPTHPLVVGLHRRNPGIRIGRTHAVAEAVVPTILGQKVTGVEQKRGWARLVRAFGEPAPGPPDAVAGLLVPPEPARLAALPYHRFHPLGIERKRADTIRHACSRAVRLEEASTMSAADFDRRLTAFPGIGPWTATIVRRIATGDADAVEPGDYNLPSLVSWNLAGEVQGDDARMFELLEPFRGHRARVVGLLSISGRWPPRRAPRAALRAFERH